VQALLSTPRSQQDVRTFNAFAAGLAAFL
jgi:hypothetical protein